MQHPDEGTIHAWIDGALTVEEAASLESHAAQCDECSAAIAEARGLVAASSRILLALDDVPAGVIPLPVPKTRAWYARNDLRAAAAVLFVASASLVVARGRQDVSPRMNDIASLSMDTAAPASASATNSTASAEARPMAVAPAQTMRKSEADAAGAADAGGSGARNTKPEAEMARQRVGAGLRRDAARPGAAGNSAPPAEAQAAPSAGVPPMVAAPMARAGRSVTTGVDLSATVVGERGAAGVGSGSARKPGSSQFRLDEVVVTGVVTKDPRAAGTNVRVIAAPPKILRADTSSSQRVQTIVYEASRGIEVTLMQTEPASLDQQTALQGRNASAAARAPSAPLPASPALATVPPGASSAQTVMKASPINSISWTDSITGRSYTLSGALPRGELEALKVRIIEQRKHGFPLP